MTVSIILPCFNPPQGWDTNICNVYTIFCDRVGIRAQLIIVFDGENNASDAVHIAAIKQHIPELTIIKYPENKGKGYAIRQGVTAAIGEVILYTDIDFPYTVDSIVTVYEGLAQNKYDVGVGVKDEHYYSQLPALRRLISKFLRLLISTFLSMPITDTQCGLKGFRASVKPLFLQTTINRYLFDLEFIRNCFQSKAYRVQAVHVKLNDDVHFRKMNYRILFPEMLNFVRLLLKRKYD